jgi:hypothetical protein
MQKEVDERGCLTVCLREPSKDYSESGDLAGIGVGCPGENKLGRATVRPQQTQDAPVQEINRMIGDLVRLAWRFDRGLSQLWHITIIFGGHDACGLARESGGRPRSIFSGGNRVNPFELILDRCVLFERNF